MSFTHSSAEVAVMPVNSFEITPKRLALVLVGVGLFLLAAHCGVMVAKHGYDHPYVGGLGPMFNMGNEMNVPTLASTLVLVTCGAMLAYTAAVAVGTPWDRRSWALLAFIFIFLGFDENISIHEGLISPVNNMINADWVPAFAWVLPYGLAVIVLGVVMLPWFLKLDRPTQIRFVIAGVVYVGGALGVEILESVNFTSSDETLAAVKASLSNDILVTTQESMEFGGAAFFLWALVKRLGGIRISS
jgi:hypothetical protein